VKQDEEQEILTDNIREMANMQRLQLLFAEQRTSLAVLRTGIAIFTLPLSVLTVLIATSKFYEIREIIHFLIPTVVILIGLIALAIWMIYRAWKTIMRIRHIIDRLKSRDECLREFLD